MKAYTKIMKYLDITIQKEKQAALTCKGLTGKLEAQKRLINLNQARNTLRLQYHDYQDYIRPLSG